MSANRFTLREFLDSLPDTQDAYDRVRDEVTDLLDTWGLDPEFVGRDPAELDDDQGAFRYQYMTEYVFVRGPKGNKSYLPVQFKTILYTTTPITDAMERYLIDVHNGRLRTLFNTGVYDGYMEGFNFSDSTSSREGHDGSEVVPRQDIPQTGIGIPRWEVEVYYDTGLAGAASGFSLDFEVEEDVWQAPDAPQHEVWYISPKGKGLNTARSPPSYEIGPKPRTPARERAKQAAGKRVYLAGKVVGEVTQRGTTWFRKEYAGSGKYTDRAEILASRPVTHQKLSPGGRLYKVAEDANSIYLVPDEPVDFDPTDPDTVSEDATGTRSYQRHLRDPQDTATTFVVQRDEDLKGALGKYDPPVERDITTETNFGAHR